MIEFLKNIGNFAIQRIGVEGIIVVIIACALIYIWFLRLKNKILGERLTFLNEVLTFLEELLIFKKQSHRKKRTTKDMS